MFQSVMDTEDKKKPSNKNAFPLKRKILCIGELRDENLISYCLENFSSALKLRRQAQTRYQDRTQAR